MREGNFCDFIPLMPMIRIIGFVNSIIRRVGLNLDFFSSATNSLARRKKILDAYDINIVLDVGANAGQYGLELRKLGYRGKIISFEPLSSAFMKLKTTAKSDKNWALHNFALGDKNGQTVINISANSYSSSILKMLPVHRAISPDSIYIGEETINVIELDSIFHQICNNRDRVYLKIDTQGFENKVLLGAKDSLDKIDIVQLEMSLTQLYRDETIFNEMLSFMQNIGFNLIGIEAGYTDLKSGNMVQVDGIFHLSKLS